MNITYGLRRALHLNPGGLATAFQGRRRNWGELGDRVARLAAGLRAGGCQPGDRVAMLATNSDRYLEYYLATAWAGLVSVPLNVRWSAREVEDALGDCQPAVLMLDRAYVPLTERLGQALPGLRFVYADDGEAPPGLWHFEDLVAQHSPAPDAMRAGPDLAGIFYTGGTTGRSKGVMLSHTNLMSNAMHSLAENMWTADMRYMHAAPMFHLANGMGLYAALLRGGSNIIVPGFAPETVMAAVEAERVTDALLVPTMIQMLVEHPALARHDLSSLRRVLYGASPMSGALLDRAMTALPRTEFVHVYGMTELSPCATALSWEGHTGESRAAGRHRSVGRAVVGCEVRTVGLDGETLPPGTVGEVVVRGDTVMLGYWERPEETARAIVDGWMHTGDGGYLDEDGYLYVVDRLKDMIISGGENVYSVEVENAVVQHPAVLQCAVIGIPDDRWGEMVHAVVVRRPEAELTVDELTTFCRTLLGGFKCPRSIEFRDTLPLSGAGKVLKRDLRAPFWERRLSNVN